MQIEEYYMKFFKQKYKAVKMEYEWQK